MVVIHAYSEEQQREAFAHRLCVPGSDATTLAPDGALAQSFFHGAYTWASWFWRFMVRDEGLLTPEDAVHRLTAQPAERIGLTDRGVLREGARADVAVFDPAAFAERGTIYEPNLLANGMRHVLVNGVATLTGRGADGRARRHGAAALSRQLGYPPGFRYWISSAFRRASSVSSTLMRTVVSSLLSAPPPAIASATAAMETLSGASQRVYPSCEPKPYQKPCSLPPTDSMYVRAASRRSSGLPISLAHVSGV